MCIQMSLQKGKGNFDRLYCIENISANIRLLRFVDIICWNTTRITCGKIPNRFDSISAIYYHISSSGNIIADVVLSK